MLGRTNALPSACPNLVNSVPAPGMPRSARNELILPTERNHHVPPVESKSLRKIAVTVTHSNSEKSCNLLTTRTLRIQRRGWDSNPRSLAALRFSRPARSTTLPPLLRNGAKLGYPTASGNLILMRGGKADGGGAASAGDTSDPRHHHSNSLWGSWDLLILRILPAFDSPEGETPSEARQRRLEVPLRPSTSGTFAATRAPLLLSIKDFPFERKPLRAVRPIRAADPRGCNHLTFVS